MTVLTAIILGNMPSVSIAHADLETSTVGVSQNSNSQSTRASREIIGADGSRIQVPNDIREESSHSYPTVEAGRAGTAAATSSKTLLFRNGVHGVIHGSPRVYLVFLGSEWGTQLNSPGATTLFSTDNSSMPYSSYLHKLLQGLGTAGDTWSNVMTQYCDNSGAIKVDTTVAPNNCLAGTATTGLPATTGALAGVWYDNAKATAFAGSTADNTVLANEAVAAALYFKTKDPLFSIENSQIVIASPKGTHPGGFNTPASNWCAWHSAATSASIGGSVAFTNLPYMPDMGAGCGANLVNAGAAGALDGVSIVEGHEYAETLSDAIPNTGWTASNGWENGDNCSWITPYGNITTSTGTFAMQSTWSNATNSCQMSAPAPVVAPPALTFSTTTPPTTAVTGTAYSYTFAVTSTSTVTYSAGTLPSGLVLNPLTGVLSGTPTSAGTFSITITASAAGYSNGLLAFMLTVTAPVLNAQPALTVVPSKTTGPAGTAISLSISGGAGTGAVSFATATTGCTASTTDSILGLGSINRTASTGSCSVTVSKAASGTYSAATSVATSISFTGVSQSALVLTPTSTSGPAGTAISLTASGGNGTAAYSLSATGTPTGCSVTQPNATTGIGAVNRSATTGSCTVTLNRAASGIYLAATAVIATITFNAVNQATLTISTSNTAQIAKGTTGIALATSGGTGTGAVTYVATATSPGTTSGSCVISGSKLTVATTATSTSTGGVVTCSVVATKAASTIYALTSSAPVVFSFK
jgi:Putative Ig domain